ncbi:uncharacterized protein LOC113393783 [Vanessa tameamea]|uniref:Uncharacterized protein LOC113393783 n=1 Tax=Vanessa tameamea TaxID=334116 RepID=A0ABM4AL23_VANTA
MGVKEKNGKKYELVAPDGGWGYMIGVGVIINLVTISTFLASFGMIFKDLFIELNMDSTTITFLNGVSALCAALAVRLSYCLLFRFTINSLFSFPGMIVNPLLKFLSLRQLGLVAATIFNLGIFGNVFVNSKLTFFLCLGVLQSLGNGLIYNISCTVLNNYFVKRRLLAVSFTQTVIGVIALFSPQFVKWTLETFGFRGTLLIISAVSLQNIVGMALMQPVEWHMKKVKVSEDNENETKSLLASEEKGFKGKEDLKPVNKSEPENDIKKSNEKFSVENTKNDEYQGRKMTIPRIQAVQATITKVRVLPARNAGSRVTVDPRIDALYDQLNFANFVIQRGRLHCRNSQIFLRRFGKRLPRQVQRIPQNVYREMVWWRGATYHSLSIHKKPATHFLATDASDVGWGGQLDGKVINFISNFIDVSLFKTFLLSNAAVGVALSLFSEYLFIFMLPQALYALGWNEGNIAWALTLNAVTDLGTRAFFIFMSSWLLNIGSHEIYVVGLVLALVTKLGMLWSDDMLVMTVFITMMGIPRCTIMLLLPVVVADSVDQDKFSSAMGIVLLLFGFFNLSVGPSIGAIRDLTNSYSTAFYILSSCFGIVIMFWTIELIYKKNKHKRIPKEEPIEA